MRVVIFSHPYFLNSTSMPRFADMIMAGLGERSVAVEKWAPRDFFHKMGSLFPRFQKWFGYIDQYVVFPIAVWLKLRSTPKDTLFVFSDQALGPWVPLVARRPHVIHCHDLMALKSALGLVPENPTGISGRIYQRYIRWGFSKGRKFICISGKTRDDLVRYGRIDPCRIEVVYNGLNYNYQPMGLRERQSLLASRAGWDERGILLHVGGNQWYKNRRGVLEIYRKYAQSAPAPLPLWMIGPTNDARLLSIASGISGGAVHFHSGFNAEELRAAYSHAQVFLFPSLDEGFGWPIAEAMACGTPVITTDQQPMTEVGDDVAYYLPRRESATADEWAARGANLVVDILMRDASLTGERRARGIELVHRKFSAQGALDSYMAIYLKAMK